MRVHSFIRPPSARPDQLQEVEIDLTLVPGLPQILILGLPDAAVRESTERIRSAIRKQGFKWPKAQRVLVQLRPNEGRKSGEGLDLAIAAALLWETKQIPVCAEPCLYGSVSLNGEVEAPANTADLDLEPSRTVFTGAWKGDLPFQSRRISCLKDLRENHEPCAANAVALVYRPPHALAESFSPRAAELAAVIAAGEHSTLLAGAAGAGKTTLAASIAAWLAPPANEEQRRAARRFARETAAAPWRPSLRPHHSITPLAMIGGGASLWAGEVHRAHTGVLILDELAEFHPAVHEALREPADAGLVQIARSGKHRELAASFLLLATTNLCACGGFVPGQTETRCRCRSMGRRRVLSRLSGPLLDRFQILAFTSSWEGEKASVSASEISARVRDAISFREARAQARPNAQTPVAEIEATLSRFQSSEILPAFSRGSRRRAIALLRVARTLADLRGSTVISNDDLNRSAEFTWRGHHLLEEARS